MFKNIRKRWSLNQKRKKWQLRRKLWHLNRKRMNILIKCWVRFKRKIIKRISMMTLSTSQIIHCSAKTWHQNNWKHRRCKPCNSSNIVEPLRSNVVTLKIMRWKPSPRFYLNKRKIRITWRLSAREPCTFSTRLLRQGIKSIRCFSPFIWEDQNWTCVWPNSENVKKTPLKLSKSSQKMLRCGLYWPGVDTSLKDGAKVRNTLNKDWRNVLVTRSLWPWWSHLM